jgi:lipopolysaccharide/colanic/teichoic acid biosynthesis glycosyltransferase
MNKQTEWLLSQSLSSTGDIRIAPSLERRRLRAYAFMVAMDAALLHAMFALAALLYEGEWWEDRTMLAVQAMLPVYLTIALYNKSYSTRALTEWWFSIRKMLITIVISAALLNFLAFYLKTNAQFSRVSVTLGLILSVVALAAYRRLLTRFVEARWNGKLSNRLVIDDGGPGFWMRNCETVVAAQHGLDPASHDPFMLDRLGRLLRNQDQVVVSCPPERYEPWAVLLKSTGIYGEIVSDHAHLLGAVGVHRYPVQDCSTLVVSTGPLGLRGRIAKRLFDLTLASAGAIVLSPLLLLVALLIKLEDGGPVLFVQRRLGRGNELFDMLKFRSMRAERLDRDGESSTARGDDRITRIGAFIRRTSIDELPQLINVLRGEMAIVGPRPHALGSRANAKLFWEVDARYWHRHSLKPGLTGLAQVRGHRGATAKEKDLTDRLQSDLEYISSWSILEDVRIVLKTLRVLRHDNAF